MPLAHCDHSAIFSLVDGRRAATKGTPTMTTTYRITNTISGANLGTRRV